MKGFEILIMVSRDGKSHMKIQGEGKAEVTTNQILTYLSAELEKYELIVTVDRTIKAVTKQMSNIQVVQDIPNKFKPKQ